MKYSLFWMLALGAAVLSASCEKRRFSQPEQLIYKGYSMIRVHDDSIILHSFVVAYRCPISTGNPIGVDVLGFDHAPIEMEPKSMTKGPLLIKAAAKAIAPPSSDRVNRGIFVRLSLSGQLEGKAFTGEASGTLTPLESTQEVQAFRQSLINAVLEGRFPVVDFSKVIEMTIQPSLQKRKGVSP